VPWTLAPFIAACDGRGANRDARDRADTFMSYPRGGARFLHACGAKVAIFFLRDGRVSARRPAPLGARAQSDAEGFAEARGAR
jgi:hypothetical protein